MRHDARMDALTLIAYWAHRQGLDGSLTWRSAEATLARTGWARTVGSCNPYLSIFARIGLGRTAIEEEARDLGIQELPAARGCTYVVPREDFALALALSSAASSSSADTKTAQKLGVTASEIDALERAILEALAGGPLDPKELKTALGDRVRHLGDEGKKRGLTTTLPVALGRLQCAGRIRRVPEGGRLDHERYAYARWDAAPDARALAATRIAERYWSWTGVASLKHFQWFTGFGVLEAKGAVAGLGLEPIEEGSSLLVPAAERSAWESFERPHDPCYRLVASLDGAFHLRRDSASLMAPGYAIDGDLAGGLTDLPMHGILDRGALVGLWEFDHDSGEIVWTSWTGEPEALRAEVARTETLVRDELGDARAFSLDSPKSRSARVASLRANMRL